MSLHNEIMNIAHKRSRPLNNSAYEGCEFHGYIQGHRDARHAAAELSLKYEHLIEELSDHFGTGIVEMFKRKCGL